MNTTEPNSLPPEVLRDAHIVAECMAAGKPIPPDVGLRVQQRADDARKKLLAARGIHNSGVRIIRGIRGDLPMS